MAEYRSCPRSCPNYYGDWGCDNPAHRPDPGWLQASLERNVVDVYLSDTLSSLSAGDRRERRKRVLAIVHKPHVRERLEQERSRLLERLRDVEALLK